MMSAVQIQLDNYPMSELARRYMRQDEDEQYEAYVKMGKVTLTSDESDQD